MKVDLSLDTIHEIDAKPSLSVREPYANVVARRCTGVELDLAIYTHDGSTTGIERARELAAALNAVADAVEAELGRRNGALYARDGSHGTPETDAADADPVDPVAESLDREQVEVAGQ